MVGGEDRFDHQHEGQEASEKKEEGLRLRAQGKFELATITFNVGLSEKTVVLSCSNESIIIKSNVKSVTQALKCLAVCSKLVVQTKHIFC